MHRLRELAIERKLILIIVLTSSVTILLACAGFVAYNVIMLRGAMKRNVSIIVKSISISFAIALASLLTAFLVSSRLRRSIAQPVLQLAQATEEIETLAKFPSENPNPVLRIAEDGRIVYANEGSAPLLKAWKCQEGQCVPDRWYEHVSNILESGHSIEIEVTSEDRVFLVSLSPVTEGGYVYAYGSDITERKEETERIQAAKMESLRHLVAGVAHQMNNPIGVALGNNDVSSRAIGRIKEIITRECSQEVRDNRRLARAITAMEKTNQVDQTALEGIEKIVANLRHFVRLDEAEWQIADIHESIDNVLALVEPDFSERIRATRDYGDVPRIYCSPSGLNQVFMVLLENASEAIEEEGEINIKTSTQGDDVRIAISDTGRGIPAEDIGKIFDPGYTTKGAKVGIGIGLAICYKIVVDEHRGRIDVSSEPGKGTTFIVTLPQHYG